MTATAPAAGPVHVTGEVVGVARAGSARVLTLAAAGLAERFRPGSFLTLAVGGPLSERLLRRGLPISRASAAHGGTVEVVLAGDDDATGWLAGAPAGTPLDVVGPLGRPFALPKEPVTCLLVGEGPAAAPLFALAERLSERGCAVHLLLGAATEAGLYGALEPRRSSRSVTVTTGDGSVGQRGTLVDALPGLLDRTAADVVYAAGSTGVLHGVARAAEAHGAWSQTMLEVPTGCGTGVCLACVVPVVGEDGVPRAARSCTEGPVLRGDRVRWSELA